MTAEEIGAGIHKSKSAVLGKARRLGLGDKPNRTVGRAPSKRKPTAAGTVKATPAREARPKAALPPRVAAPIRRVPPPSPPPVPLPAESAATAPTVKFDALGANQCMRPVGDPMHKDFGYCGQPCRGSYCDACKLLLYEKPRSKATVSKSRVYSRTRL